LLVVAEQAVSWLPLVMVLLPKPALLAETEALAVALVMLATVLAVAVLVAEEAAATKADKVAVLVLDNQEYK